MKSSNNKWIIYILILILIFALVQYFILYKDTLADSSKIYDLKKDGVCSIKNVLTPNEIEMLLTKCNENKYKEMKYYLINHSYLKNKIQSETTTDHIFQDYIWIIKKSTVHTCHRDNNGDFFNANQKHPSYTMLVYLENMEKCLGVIPESHSDVNSHNFNVMDKVVNLRCSPGDVILFNANLIHVGSFNKKEDNVRIQMKVSNKEDIETLSYYENYNKVLNEDNVLPIELRRAQKRFSCMFPVLSNITQRENIRTARGSDNGVQIGYFQQMFSFLFYGNPKFYDLPNAF